ncbi:MAG: DUF3800 domain-containing protein [bacterium]|nr:DUF3800 domain-containing protein [bacterium]
MWLSYLDESGNTGGNLEDPDQPFHLIAAVMVPEDQIQPLSTAFDHLPAFAREPRLIRELRGADLYSGKGPWRGSSPSERIDTYREALALLGQHEAFVAHASIDKWALRQSAPSEPKMPHLLALRFLAEEIDSYLKHQHDPLKQRTLLIADETDEHEAYAHGLVAQMQVRKPSLAEGPALTRIVDQVHFVQSETSPGVQLADLAAFALTRRMRFPTTSRRPSDIAIARLAEIVDSRVVASRDTWPPRDEGPPSGPS